MALGLTPISSKASITAICASPRAPPPPSASANVFIRRGSFGAGLEREFPALGGKRPHQRGALDGVRAGRGAVADAADNTLEDRRDAEEVVSRIHREIRPRIEAGALHIGFDIGLAARNAERGQIMPD